MNKLLKPFPEITYGHSGFALNELADSAADFSGFKDKWSLPHDAELDMVDRMRPAIDKFKEFKFMGTTIPQCLEPLGGLCPKERFDQLERSMEMVNEFDELEEVLDEYEAKENWEKFYDHPSTHPLRNTEKQKKLELEDNKMKDIEGMMEAIRLEVENAEYCYSIRKIGISNKSMSHKNTSIRKNHPFINEKLPSYCRVYNPEKLSLEGGHEIIEITREICRQACSAYRERWRVFARARTQFANLPLRQRWTLDVEKDRPELPRFSNRKNRCVFHMMTGVDVKMGGWKYRENVPCPGCGMALQRDQGVPAFEHFFACESFKPSRHKSFGSEEAVLPTVIWKRPLRSYRYYVDVMVSLREKDDAAPENAEFELEKDEFEEDIRKKREERDLIRRQRDSGTVNIQQQQAPVQQDAAHTIQQQQTMPAQQNAAPTIQQQQQVPSQDGGVYNRI